MNKLMDVLFRFLCEGWLSEWG